MTSSLSQKRNVTLELAHFYAARLVRAESMYFRKTARAARTRRPSDHMRCNLARRIAQSYSLCLSSELGGLAGLGMAGLALDIEAAAYAAVTSRRRTWSARLGLDPRGTEHFVPAFEARAIADAIRGKGGRP